MRRGNAPDYIEPTVGWRVWLVVANDARQLCLRSITFVTVWTPRAELRARCIRPRRLLARIRRESPHEVPALGCDCGIHAAKDAAAAVGYLSAYEDLLKGVALHRVIGTVSLWGKVVEGERGWRASHAYRARLLVPPSRDSSPVPAEAVARSLVGYGVPSRLASVRTRSSSTPSPALDWRAPTHDALLVETGSSGANSSLDLGACRRSTCPRRDRFSARGREVRSLRGHDDFRVSLLREPA